MTAEKHKIEYKNTPFHIETSSVETKPGCWNWTLVEVFKHNNKIGEYTYAYSSLNAPFYPFEHKDKWYALYSKHYTATRVAILENDKFEDWCGEESSSTGFCPVEYYVPRVKYLKHYYMADYRAGKKLDIPEKSDIETFVWDNNEKEWQEETKESLVGNGENVLDYKETNVNFGFISGCRWGDDTSWKLRYIDFSELENKKLVISDRFGYFELPHNFSLKQCFIPMDELTGFNGRRMYVVQMKCHDKKEGFYD